MKQYYIPTLYLSMCRIIFCFMVLLFTGLANFSWLGSDLNMFFAPPALSLAAAVGEFPSNTFFVLLSVFNLICFTAMFIGFHSKISSIAFSITAIIGYSFWYSFGKIDHNLLWLLTPVFLSLAGWGNYFTLNKTEKHEEKDNSLYITLLAICIGFSMFTSGVQKIMGGWLSWEAEAVRYHLTRNIFANGRTELLAEYFLKIDNHIVWKFFDYSSLALEIGFLVSIVKRTYFQAFLAMAVLFHILVLLMFNIVFSSNLFAYLAFLNWKGIFSLLNWNISVSNPRLQTAMKRVLYLGIVGCIGSFFYQLKNPNVSRLPSWFDFLNRYPDAPYPTDLSSYLLFILAFLTLVISLIASFKQTSRKSYVKSEELENRNAMAKA